MKRVQQNIRSTVWRYYAFTFLRSFMLFIGVLVPFYTLYGGLTLFQVQLIQSWFVLWVFLLEVPTGAVADRLGRKVSLLLGAFGLAIAFVVYGSFNSLPVFLVGEFLAALSLAFLSGADQALLYDSLKEVGKEEESKKIIGRAHAVSLAGIGLAAPLGSLAAGLWGLNMPFILTAIPMLLAAIIVFTMKEPAHARHSEGKRYVDVIKKGFMFFYTHKTLRVLAVDAVVVASAAYFVVWFYQPLLERSGVPLFYFGFFQTILIIVEILIASNFTRLEKIFGSPKILLRWSALLTAVGFLCVALQPNIFTIVLFLILAGGFGLTRMELLFAYMHKFIPSEQRATVLSSISMLRRFALILLNPFIGFIADQSLQVALLVVGILPLLVFLFSPIEKEMLE